MSRHLKRTALAGGLLLVVGIGVASGIYRMKRLPLHPNSPARRKRRQEMREALARAVNDPDFIREMEEIDREWDAVVGDGLEDV